ncbi:ribosomal protein S7 [Ascobolus immersus RN42]|uniref:Small ribosomal subunit protein uS7m n=1 Tax=Ascobolus immersus RN42 TaxID=1160509 RepID=A0A3N4IGD3_ASCIM|nr:ribosomal protein S7 [Ascobolus immersus RN42]
MYRSDVLAETHGYPRIFFPVSTQTPPNPDDIYGLPKLPLPGTYRMTDRYVPIVDQVTNMIMQHGMKAKAQANMAKILGYLRTKPMPKPSAKYSMIAGSPPLSTLPSNPIAYLQTAIDSIAPLVKLKSVRGSGGFSNTVPVPLNLRQRRRTAIVWILDAVAKRVPGPIRFPEKFAEEIIAVVEGRSKAWEKRNQAHKTAVASRANVKA